MNAPLPCPRDCEAVLDQIGPSAACCRHGHVIQHGEPGGYPPGTPPTPLPVIRYDLLHQARNGHGPTPVSDPPPTKGREAERPRLEPASLPFPRVVSSTDIPPATDD